MSSISSASNERIKLVRRLATTKGRRETGLFFVEGIRLVVEAVQVQANIEFLLTAPGLLTSELALDLLEQARASGITCLELTDSLFRRIADKEGPAGIAAVVHQEVASLDEDFPSTLAYIVLDQIQDPGNLGTILRTADAVGSHGIILLGNCTDSYHPNCVRASMGAIFTQRILHADIDSLAEWKQVKALTMTGVARSGGRDFQAHIYASPAVICLGSEQHGLSPDLKSLCDEIVFIPMAGRSDSLNLAVATSLILYEIFNQRRAGAAPP